MYQYEHLVKVVIRRDRTMREVITEAMLAAIVMGAVGYLWYRFRKLEDRMEKTMMKREVVELIEYKIAPINTEQIGIKEDIKDLTLKIDTNQHRVEIKLDRLIDKLLK